VKTFITYWASLLSATNTDKVVNHHPQLSPSLFANLSLLDEPPLLVNAINSTSQDSPTQSPHHWPNTNLITSNFLCRCQMPWKLTMTTTNINIWKKGNLVEEERNNEYQNFRGSDLLPRVIVGDTVYTRRRTKKSIERSDSSNSIHCQRMQ
jgi:hypothetical protein